MTAGLAITIIYSAKIALVQGELRRSGENVFTLCCCGMFCSATDHENSIVSSYKCVITPCSFRTSTSTGNVAIFIHNNGANVIPGVDLQENKTNVLLGVA